MLSIIICSISPEYLQRISQNIDETIGVEHEIVAIDNRERKWPIARVYNEGARKARYPYLFFVHEDVKFHSQDWGKFIEEKLSEPDCGVIGFAGSKAKFESFSGWVQHKRLNYAFYYQGKNDVSMLSVSNIILEHPFEEVVILDGLGLFVRKDVWNAYPFDEDMLTGFHCYDIDFTLQIAASKKYKNYVCCSPKVIIEHFSEGNYNRSWFQDTILLHKQKWSKILPLAVSDLDLTEKEMRKYDEHSFNRFMRKLLKSDCPEKGAVLWHFLKYPMFSWKHVGHCFQNIWSYFMHLG